MNEEILNQILLTASKLGSVENLERFRSELCILLQDYKVEKVSKEIMVRTYALPPCYEYFLVTKKIEGMADTSLELYKSYIAHCLQNIAKPVEQITANDIRAYLFMTQKQRNISNRTLDSRRSCLRSFFEWIAAEGYISKNPMTTVKPIKYEVKEREPIEAINLELIRENCKDLREKAVVEVFYSTGCRVTELTRLNRNDINMTTGEVKLFGKGNKHRTSYLSPKAKLYLTQYLDSRTDDNEALFVGIRHPHNRVSKRSIEDLVRQIGDRCNIYHLHPHLFRHTCATDALNRGMPITQVKQLLGHSSLDTTMIYAKVNQSDVAISHSKYLN